MPFEKVDSQVDLPAQERSVLEFWDKIGVFEKLREKNRGKKIWSFLDGPITANNPMGVHHAWGRTYKDTYQRYHAMMGYDQRYQNGFDCQGLWVEVEVEKELKLKSKRDIENLVPGDKFASIDKFVQLCKDRVNKFARVQTDQSIRLGYWMDWDRTDEDWARPSGERKSYFTMSEENNFTIWAFLKKCHKRGLVYKGYDAMPWCARCGVGLSQMEMHEGYKMVAHRAVFVKFPLRERAGENLLVWTTTPWTLSSNVGAAVNPELTYLKVRQGDELYYMAKGAFTAKRKESAFKNRNKGEWVEGVPKLKPLEQVFKEKGEFEIEGEIKGEEMIGWAYDGPFDELDAQSSKYGYPWQIARVVEQQKWGPEQGAKELHCVIPWKDVGEEEGTGIVHIAPGCGAADFELGKEHGLVPIAPLDDYGTYVKGFGELTGKLATAHETTDWILEHLTEKGVLFSVEKYPHSYPHCWRCKSEVLFRLVDEWFINMSWRDEIMKVCSDIRWIPEFGLQRELDWLKNMGDWMISKKRFWGLALPIWIDEETEDFEVIGSMEELKERAVEGIEHLEGRTPHRPWIDKVKIKNPKNGNLMSRIPDVGNPWLDAGIVPYSTMKYNTDREYWEKWFPADFVTESFPGQFRNWFYSLLAMSTMMEGRAPFKNLLGHGLVRDQWGDEMHKSAGNSIPFEGAADGQALEEYEQRGYVIKHLLKSNEKPVVPGAFSVKVIDEVKDDKKLSFAVAHCPPMSADVVRWLYMRHNPAHNINFGPRPAQEIKNKFFDKLINTYKFFCELARVDDFDPTQPQVPVSERPDVDQWILSDLQKLIQKAHKEFPVFSVQAFCLEAENFVEARLSNWYVRRNKRRFWEEEGNSKLAAYQTLYTVLMTLTKLFAPVIPFLTESMFQNLKSDNDKEESVHHCDYPEADESLIDDDLSADTEALLRLASLGLAARNAVKIKVRQPLAELKVQPGDERDRRAVERFGTQLCEELNVKKVSIHEPGGKDLLVYEVKPNFKSLGQKVGAQVQAVAKVIGQSDSAELAAKVTSGNALDLMVDGMTITLEPTDLIIQPNAEEGWSGLSDRKTQVALDTRLTEELRLEGLMRDIIRYVQNSRKEADLAIEDRIVLSLETDSTKLNEAIERHREYIAAETLVREWANGTLDGQATFRTEVKVEGEKLKIGLKKAE